MKYLAKFCLLNTLVLLLLLGPWSTASSTAQRAASKLNPAELYKATKNPDRIVLTWTADPATSQTVNWRTDDSVEKGYAEIAETEDGPKFVRKLKRVASATDTLESDFGKSKYHHVTFQDLKPETKYVYRVGDGTNWSEFSQFETASTEAKPFSFVYFGDSQNDVYSHWSRVVREAFRDAPRASFFLHAGDLVNRPNSDREWGEWFSAAGWINRSVPCLATPGNHEYNRGTLSQNWKPTFEFPKNGPEGFEDTVYYIDMQGMRLISLNTNEAYEKQIEWLDRVLQDNPHPWSIVTFHHPVFSTAAGRDNAKWRELIVPVMNKHKVDLVLQGHDHTYGRTGLVQSIDEVDIQSEKNIPVGRSTQSQAGTIYVVSVSGPKMYKMNPRFRFQKTAENKQLYQIISINGNMLRYSARTAAGKIYDEFQLTKENGEKKLVNRSE